MPDALVFPYSNNPNSPFFIDSRKIPGYGQPISFPPEQDGPTEDTPTRRFDFREYLRTLEERGGKPRLDSPKDTPTRRFDSRRYLRTLEERGGRSRLGAEPETRVVPTQRVIDILREQGAPASNLVSLTKQAAEETREKKLKIRKEGERTKNYSTWSEKQLDLIRYGEARILLYKDPLLRRDEELVVIQKEGTSTDYVVVPGTIARCTPDIHITNPSQQRSTHIDIECIVSNTKKENIRRFLKEKSYEEPIVFWS